MGCCWSTDAKATPRRPGNTGAHRLSEGSPGAPGSDGSPPRLPGVHRLDIDVTTAGVAGDSLPLSRLSAGRLTAEPGGHVSPQTPELGSPQLSGTALSSARSSVSDLEPPNQPIEPSDSRFHGVLLSFGGLGSARADTLDRGVTVAQLRLALAHAQRLCAREGWTGLRPDTGASAGTDAAPPCKDAGLPAAGASLGADGGEAVEAPLSPEALSLHDLVANWIVPFTRDAGGFSFAEVVNTGPRRAVYYVSVHWAEEVTRIATCLERLLVDRGLPADTPFWHCAFALNHLRLGEEAGPSLESEASAQALRGCRGTVAVADLHGRLFGSKRCMRELLESIAADEDDEGEDASAVAATADDRAGAPAGASGQVPPVSRHPPAIRRHTDIYTALPPGCDRGGGGRGDGVGGAVGLTDGVTAADEAGGSLLHGGPATAKALRERCFPPALVHAGAEIPRPAEAEAAPADDRPRIPAAVTGRECALEATLAAAVGSRAAGAWLGRDTRENLEALEAFCRRLAASRLARLTIWCEGTGGGEGAAALGRALPLTLASLSLHGVHRAVAPFVARLVVSGRALTELELVDAAMGDAGVAQLAGVIPGAARPLAKLRLDCNGIGPEGARALAAGLGAAPTRLHTIGLARNPAIGEVGMRALGPVLRTCTGLRVIALGNTGLGAGGAAAFAAALEALPEVEILELSSNDLRPEGVTAIARAISHHARLRDLAVQQNGAGDAGAEALGAAVRSHANLRVFCAFDNRIGDAGFGALCGGLGQVHSLRKLNLALNPASDASVPALAAVVKSQRALSDLRLHDTKLSDMGWADLCGSLGALPALAHVDFGNSAFGDAAAAALTAALAPNGHLAHLRLCGSQVTDLGADHVSKLVGACPRLREVHLKNVPVVQTGASAVLAEAASGAIVSLPHLSGAESAAGAGGGGAHELRGDGDTARESTEADGGKEHEDGGGEDDDDWDWDESDRPAAAPAAATVH